MDVMTETFDRNILKCAMVTACPNCERKGTMPPSNMRKDEFGVFECKVCGMQIDTNLLEECEK